MCEKHIPQTKEIFLCKFFSRFDIQFHYLEQEHVTHGIGSQCGAPRVIPYQINKKIPTLLDFHEIWHRHGLCQETFSHQNLADFIDLPLRYNH